MAKKPDVEQLLLQVADAHEELKASFTEFDVLNVRHEYRDLRREVYRTLYWHRQGWLHLTDSQAAELSTFAVYRGKNHDL